MTFNLQKRKVLDRLLRLNISVFFTLLVWISSNTAALCAEQVLKVTWADLIPKVEIYNDPFLKLSPEQKLDLVIVTRTRQLKSRGVDITPEQLERFNMALKRLKKDKIDIDGLLALREEIIIKRKHAMEAVNETLNQKQIRLAGYVLPLEMDGMKVTEFLLVPYVGACIHEPVPPANQIVLVKFAQGIEITGRFTPVWINGKMITQNTSSQLFLIDGASSIPSSYTLEADSIEVYKR